MRVSRCPRLASAFSRVRFYRFCWAYTASPKSMLIKGSFPTVHASCPGGIEPTSPGPNSASDPSSIRTTIRPEMTWIRWPTWQLSVPTTGLTHSDQHHPGLYLALVKGTYSSGASKLFFTIFAMSHLQANCFSEPPPDLADREAQSKMRQS